MKKRIILSSDEEDDDKRDSDEEWAGDEEDEDASPDGVIPVNCKDTDFYIISQQIADDECLEYCVSFAAKNGGLLLSYLLTNSFTHLFIRLFNYRS